MNVLPEIMLEEVLDPLGVEASAIAVIANELYKIQEMEKRTMLCSSAIQFSEPPTLRLDPSRSQTNSHKWC